MRLGARISGVAFQSFGFRTLFAVVLLGITAGSAIGQTNSQWSGNVVCTLNDQDANYFRQETQTWTLTGGAPTLQGAMHIYPATWTATGQGQRQIVQGTQTTNVQWSVSSLATATAQIDIFVRASDNRLIIKPWHSQLSVFNAVTGTQEVLVNGAAQSSNNISYTEWEWQFPRIEATATATNVSGSTQSQADAGGAAIVHHYGGVPPSTVCQWNFTKGGAASAPSQSGGTQNPGGTMPGSNGAGTTGSGTQNPPTGSGTTQNPPSSGSTGGTGSQNTGGTPSGGTGSTTAQTPPAPINVTATAGNGSASLSWNAPVGSSIAGYTVLVLPSGSSINASTTSLTVPGLTNGSTYMFQVTASSAQGVQSAPAFSNAVTPVAATVTTTGTTVAPTGVAVKIPSTVTPIQAATPTMIATATPATPTAPVLKPVPGVVANPVKPTTTSTPPPASGNYLITLSALQCIVPTRDDPLNRDGTGDEIYTVVFVRQYERKTGQPLNSAYPQTRIYGDLTGFPDHNFPDRIQAGTHSASGGIQSPNFIPDGANPFAKRTLPPQADQFPLQIWQGTLADNGDVLVLSPSIWESDGDMTVLNQWIQSQVSLTSSLFLTSKVQNQITNQAFGPIVLGVSESVAGGIPNTIGASAAIGIISATFGLPPFEILFYGTGKDRPIGLNDGGSATSTQSMLPNTTLVLTREIIETQVLRNGQTYYTMPIQFTDHANFGAMDGPGSYMMFLQIERQ